MAAVKFLPIDVTILAAPGDTILDAALENGIELEHECGGNCACTTCLVIIESGAEYISLMEEVERDRLTTADRTSPLSRLACQAILRGGDVTASICSPE